ncbi:MAG: YncE family protein [Rhodanobacteraceae bacterium]|nr:MAG: YncE family protein [Rhodanobacteraceae bacterium]
MSFRSVISTPRAALAVRLAATLALGWCGAAGTAAAAPESLLPAPAYVTLQSSNAVENIATGKVWGDLPGAHYDAASPDGTLLLVSSSTTPDVYLVATATGTKLATFDIGQTPQGVAIGPGGRWGLAVSAGTGTVAVIDLKTRKVARKIAVGKTPHNVRFAADGKRAYVTLQGGTGVAVLDMQTLAKTGEIPVPGIQGPHNLDVSADGHTLWVRDLAGHVAAVDLATGKELAVIKVGAGHAGIDVIPGGRYVFTGAIADHVVDVIDPQTFRVVKRIEVGQGPHGVRASRDGRWVYVGVTATNQIAVIDTHTLEVVRQIATNGKYPFWVSVAGNE